MYFSKIFNTLARTLYKVISFGYLGIKSKQLLSTAWDYILKMNKYTDYEMKNR